MFLLGRRTDGCNAVANSRRGRRGKKWQQREVISM
jgi:hypothetical protein